MVAMDVVVNGKRVKRLRHKNEHTWDLDWADFRFEFEASGASVTLEFKSVNSACGCMLLDDVTLQPKQCIATTTTTRTTTTTTTTASPAARHCANGWTMLNGKCARRFGFAYKERKSWEAAEEGCVSKGGHLASVADANQLKALASFCFRGLQTNWKIDCAVGLRRGKGGAFVWTDGLRFNSELAKGPHMSTMHSKADMYIDGHDFGMLEGDYDGSPGRYVYVCGVPPFRNLPSATTTTTTTTSTTAPTAATTTTTTASTTTITT